LVTQLPIPSHNSVGNAGSLADVRVPAAEREGTVRKVLLATDGSQFSDRAVQSIVDRPWPAGTEVCVLSAVELMLPAGYEPGGDHPKIHLRSPTPMNPPA